MCVAWGELGPLILHCPHVHLTPTGAAAPSLPYRTTDLGQGRLIRKQGLDLGENTQFPGLGGPRNLAELGMGKARKERDETEPLWGKLEPVVKNRQRKWGRQRRLEPSTGAWPDWGLQAPAEPSQKSRLYRMPGIKLRSNSLPSVLSSGSFLQHLTGRSKTRFS